MITELLFESKINIVVVSALCAARMRGNDPLVSIF